MKKSTVLLAIAALFATFIVAGCAQETTTEPAPEVTPQEQPAKTDPDSGNGTPAAQTLGIQENPNGTNPGLGSK